MGEPAASHPDPEPSEAEAWAILLSVPDLGPASFGALLREHGDGRRILASATRPGAAARLARVVASVEGRGPMAPEVGQGIVDLARSMGPALRLLRATDLTILTLDDPFYPARLREMELPPPVLFVRGEVTALSARRAVAIVGTRRPTERGRLTAARIAAAVAEAGAVVVSGLAVGIDGAAHAATADAGRLTVAVLGSGHDHLFPRAHVRLAERIVANGGAVISEFWPALEAAQYTFPRRNRVISGLCTATVVVEAGIRSGALITAKWALEQGRDCFIVPGPIDEPRSAGCLLWLRDYAGAAKIVVSIPDLIAELGLFDGSEEGATPGLRPSLEAELIELGQTAREVARALLATRGTLDDLVAATGHEVATVLGAITLLELRGLATTTYGRYRAAGRLASAMLPATPRRLPHRASPC